jgi:hypothetical protein
MRAYCLLSTIVLVLGSQELWAAQAESHHHAEPVEKLGTVSFPISCAPGVQARFERGVALLHSFWYDEAGNQFHEIAEKDPACAMAYWGEAMSFYHELWHRPDEAHLKRGWELVQKAEATGEKTQRERDYIEALAGFYRDYGKVDHDKRATAYSKGMEKVYKQCPYDNEAAVFYACRCLRRNPRPIRSWLTRRRRFRSLMRC